LGDEAISAVLRGDCCGKKRLAMTGLGIFGQALSRINLIMKPEIAAAEDDIRLEV